jgi:NitT/TauT family transport system ATP-binding protein
MSEILFNEVGMRFPGRTILNRVHLPVSAGELVTAVGPSGCGKSTLLNLLFGALPPSIGSVAIDGEEVEEVSPKVGIVYQDYRLNLLPNATVLDNVALGYEGLHTNLLHRVLLLPRYWRIRREALERARVLLADVGLPADAEKKYPHELSGGMQQRVAIALALITQPTVLVMDEPCSGLDETTRRGIQDLVLSKWDGGKMTIFFVSHDLREAVFLGSRVIGLSQHWTYDDGAPGNGALVVVDIEPPGGRQMRDQWYKQESEFLAAVELVRRTAIEPSGHKPLKLSERVITHSDGVVVEPRAQEVSHE